MKKIKNKIINNKLEIIEIYSRKQKNEGRSCKTRNASEPHMPKYTHKHVHVQCIVHRQAYIHTYIHVYICNFKISGLQVVTENLTKALKNLRTDYHAEII